MQKKIIALAVAGLMSGAAFAQSNVTIYGSIDMGYLHSSDNKTNGVGSRGGFDSGVSKGNRIGFKGTEDLGNGLSASFTYENGMMGDTSGATSGMWNTTNRQSFLALSSKTYGTVAAGRQYTPQHLFYGAADPFGNDGIGQVGNTVIKDVRLDNLVAYVSPTFGGGFTIIGGYSRSATGDESTDNEVTTAIAAVSETTLAQDARVYALAGKYENGPIFAGLNYHNIKTNNGTAALDGIDVDVWDIMGTYDLGMVKLHGSYGSRDVEGVAETNQWMLGVSAPLGNGRLMASYADRSTDFNGGPTADIDTWAIGYNYNLSKRTYAYVVYASQDQDNTAQALAKGAGLINFGADLGTGNSTNGRGYQDGLSIGVVHNF